MTDTLLLQCAKCERREVVYDDELRDGQPVREWWLNRDRLCDTCTAPPPSQEPLIARPDIPLSRPNRPGYKLAHDGTDTSAKAAVLVAPKAGTQRMRVLAAIADTDSTDAELVDLLGLPGNSVRPRRLELVEQGWVEDSGRRREHGASGEGIVWRLTTLGRRTWEDR